MDKILIALVMFFMAMVLKEKIEKKAGEKLEKELEKATGFNKPSAVMANDLEKAIAKSVPNIYNRRKAEIQEGLKKITNPLNSHKITTLQREYDKQRFFS